MKYLLLLLTITVNAQCIEPVDYNTLPGNWTLGNPCNVDYFIEKQHVGDLILKGDNYIRNAKLIVTGQIIYNGFTITKECDNSEIVELRLSEDEYKFDKPVLYPNPTKGDFYINTKKPYKVNIYTIQGRKIKEIRTSGIYIIEVIIENKRYIFKLVRQ